MRRRLLVVMLLSAVACAVLLWFSSRRRTDGRVGLRPQPKPAPRASAWPTASDEPIQRLMQRERSRMAARPSAEASPPVEEPTRTEVDPPMERDAIPGEYVLGFYSAADLEAFARLARARGIAILGRLAMGNAIRIGVSDRRLLDELLREAPTPVEVGRNYFMRSPTPEDLEKRSAQAGYVGFGGRVLAWLGIEGENADWGAGVTVAVLDTAVGKHASLDEPKVLRVNPFGVDATGDRSGHGTAVATLIAGNGQGVSGVAPGVSIVSIPVMNGKGSGDSFTLAQGIMEAVALGADVINLSLGSHGDSFVLRDAIQHAIDNNVAVVASTGNDAVNAVAYPARYAGVIAVGAVDARGSHLYFSNRGAEVDIAAPGLGVAAGWDAGQRVGFSGTSAAAPLVSAAIAVLVSQSEGLDPLAAAEVLTAYADDGGLPGSDAEYGSGILSLERALQRGESGVFNVSAMPPYLSEANDSGEVTLYVYAQNRGTEVLANAMLEVEIDGATERLVFQNLQPGASMAFERVLSPAELAARDTLEIVHRVILEGREDTYPNDNARESVLTLFPQEAPEPEL